MYKKIVLTCLALMVIIIVVTSGRPISVKMNLGRQIRLLRKLIAKEKRRTLNECNKRVEDPKQRAVPRIIPVDAEETQAKTSTSRRRKMLAKFLTTCNPQLRKACRKFQQSCEIHSMFKRSVDDDGMHNIAKRSAPGRPNHFKFNISCELCKSICWK